MASGAASFTGCVCRAECPSVSQWGSRAQPAPGKATWLVAPDTARGRGVPPFQESLALLPSRDLISWTRK